MHAEDRLIYFATELLHPPVQHKVPVLQKLYYELSKTRTVAYDNTDFNVPNQPKFYSRRGKQTHSVVVFLPDRLLVIEEWVDTALADFIEKVREIASQAISACALRPFIAQTATLRSTFALTHFDDARVFLVDHACHQAGRIGPYFKRPVIVGGLRFILPETPDHASTLHVIIESFKANPSEVFVEVKGIFSRLHIDAAGLDQTRENIQRVRSFITDCIFPFLNQYDTPREEQA